MAPPSPRITLAQTPTSWGMDLQGPRPEGRIYGWRKALSTMNMSSRRRGRQDFTMSSAVENHMTKEDLGPQASKQDWTDLKTLREELRWWEETIYSWATQQRRETDGLKYLRRHKTKKAHDHDHGTGMERAKKKYPASTGMQAPE